MRFFRSGLVGLTFAVVFIQSGLAQMHVRWASGPPPPLHPTLIFGDYKGKSLPIVSVNDESPEVMVEGKLKRLQSGSKAHYQPRRGVAYASGSIDLKNVNLSSSKTNLVYMFQDGGEVSGGTLSANSEFLARVNATQAYTDCYVVIVFFEQAYLPDETNNPHATVQFKKVRDLVPGENKIKLSFGYLDFGERSTGYFPIFFTHGLEIRSDQRELIAQFFHRMEMTVHEMYLKDYLQKYPDKSKQVNVYLQVPPLFPDGTDFSDTPATVSANFMVSEDGKVESLQFKEHLSPEVGGALRRTLSGWLFFPRLKEGRPVRTMVSVPIVLKPDEPPKAPSEAH